MRFDFFIRSVSFDGQFRENLLCEFLEQVLTLVVLSFFDNKLVWLQKIFGEARTMKFNLVVIN